MGNTLGSTNDPKSLIPGDVGKLDDLEDALNKWSSKFDGIGNGLRDMRIKGWVGQASDVFWPTLSEEKKNWYFASDAMSGAAKAVKSYASTLSWAQGQAGAAIDTWNGGDHEGAEHLLSTARKQLKQEAQTLAKRLNDLAGSASDSPDWLVATRSGVDAKKWASDHNVAKSAISPTAWAKENAKWMTDADSHWRRRQKEFGKDADGNWYLRNKPGESDDLATPGKKTDVNIKLAEWSGNASAWSAGVSGEKVVDGVTLKGAAGLATLGVDGSVGAGVTNGRVQAGASGTAYLAQASANGSVNYGMIGAQSEVKAFAGADTSAVVSAGKDGLHAGAGAFAGGKVTGAASADVGGLGAGVNGEAWAGAGAEANVDLGMQGGKFTIGGEAGAGLGLGGKVGVNISIDPGKMIDSLDDAADAVGGAWDHTVGSWL
ncbi:putative T7SS-secreted protein [Streptomyces sp. TS71-3]|uniref:putative T7SS-secreted protein n=1 Tax=Streptomyces sp. TS71-3 TaxID=2733862 RepID=UPI001B146DD2|nr:hypothetical protein [Streptomyces sp. TS71-3]GHJ36016.1 hypothetical protein Sm713_16250 [Streptomyces sp. TS71-3]